MKALAIFLVLIIVATITASPVAASPPPSSSLVSWATANRAVVVTASLTPTNKTLSNAKGSAEIFIPRPDKSNTIIVNITLTGSLQNITMAHIHMKEPSAGNPIAVFLQPRLNFTAKPALLDPPVSFKGTYSFMSTYRTDNLTLVTPGWDVINFFYMLEQGLLYVNVHTTAQPGGALQGTLSCKFNMCMWPVCAAAPGHSC